MADLESIQQKIIAFRWLIEASLYAHSNGSAAIRDLLGSPSLFPFQLKSITADHLRSVSLRLESLRHGLDEDLVMIRKNL